MRLWLVPFLAATLSAAPNGPARQDWIALFNGKDLTR